MPSEQTAIRVKNLGKYYHLSGPHEKSPMLRDAIVNTLKAPLKLFQTSPVEEGFWALRDVSFEVMKGEIVGIIGRNGAGKSTLLKILSRITHPTEGSAEIFGRVGSLLEVGTGFHPELTGRENIYLSGSILGMKKTEIERNFDEIVKFSEIGKFIDTPAKRYSSGMYVRLAFSVAAHLEPEIMIIDEVLAVGDYSFQKKCLRKMDEVAQGGRTVLFVSHNMAAVQNLCDTCYLLEGGRIVESGPTDKVISSYLNPESFSSTEKIWDNPKSAPGNQQVKIHYASIRPLNFQENDKITINTPFILTLQYWNLIPGVNLLIEFRLYNDQGVIIFDSLPLFEPNWRDKPFPAGLFESDCTIPGNLLNAGKYRVQITFFKNYNADLFVIEDILRFEIVDVPLQNSKWYEKSKGILRSQFTWNTKLIQYNS
jgi:lipopolysaccharide transport system ATP-binding protein